jgi:hypothetical protein
MKEEPNAHVFPKGLRDEFPDGPPTVVVTHRGCRFVLRFAAGDFAGEGELQELRLEPDTEKLEPRVLRQFSPQIELYLAYARAAMRVFGPEGTPESRQKDFAGAAVALRVIAGPGRALTDEFYRTIAAHYDSLDNEGEPHPTKALGQAHQVTISAASRWITEAKRRGYIKDREEQS